MDDLTQELVATLELSIRYLEHPDVAAMDFAYPVANVTERAKAAIQRAKGTALPEPQPDGSLLYVDPATGDYVVP